MITMKLTIAVSMKLTAVTKFIVKNVNHIYNSMVKKVFIILMKTMLMLILLLAQDEFLVIFKQERELIMPSVMMVQTVFRVKLALLMNLLALIKKVMIM